VTKTRSDKPTVIKKYANRRLYDTGRSSYVTLDDLCTMVKEGRDFVVYDAKSGDDLTRSVLTQIIVEQEGKEGQQNLLPITFLRQLIGFYGDSIQSAVPNYLEQSLESFVKNQERFRDMFSVPAFEEINRQNMTIFENAMRAAWTPFTNTVPGAKKSGSKDEE
jgi:polyhydroxyalkanoate synthesis repressor PhaR